MILYLDCSNGVSGDMLAAALCDLCDAVGIDGGRVVGSALTAVGVDPGAARFARGRSGGLAAATFNVADRPGCSTFGELQAVIEGSGLDEAVRRRAADVARRMAVAESAAHGEGHADLHELAGLDTLVDLVAVSSLAAALAPDQVVASPPALGGGHVRGAHGRLSVPVPAVVDILRGVPTAGGDAPDVGELTTPTGAALLVTLADAFGRWPAGRVVAAGTGAGARELPGRANVLRAVLIEPSDASTAGRRDGGGPWSVERLALLETTVDDLSAEYVADAVERLRTAGAKDAWLTPVVMKKGRSGATIHALAPCDLAEECARVMFEHTATFGVRLTVVERWRLGEGEATVMVEGCPVRVRLGVLDGRVVTASPEYEDCRRAGERSGLAPRVVAERAQAVARSQADLQSG